MTTEKATYTREEMDEILRRALARQHARADEVDRDDLVAAAEEVGIPREEVERAAREVEAERAGQRAAADAKAIRRARAGRQLVRSVATWALFSVFFFLLSTSTGGGWWVFPVLGWGVGVAVQVVTFLLGGDVPAEETREARRERRRRAREQRREQRRAEKMREFEHNVERGADALIKVLDEAKRVHARVTEGAPRVRVEPPAHGARVATDDHAGHARREAARDEAARDETAQDAADEERRGTRR